MRIEREKKHGTATIKMIPQSGLSAQYQGADQRSLFLKPTRVRTGILPAGHIFVFLSRVHTVVFKCTFIIYTRIRTSFLHVCSPGNLRLMTRAAHVLVQAL